MANQSTKPGPDGSAEPSRRDFVKTSTAVVTATALGATALSTTPVHAAGSDSLRVAIVGCGRRGNSALSNCLDAGKHLNLDMKVVATADYFGDKAEETGAKHGVPAENCFGGPQGYLQVMQSEADVVLLTTPPNFRPIQFQAAIAAGKHVFMEKPVAVDPPGARKLMAAGDLAAKSGLAVVAGTQRRHEGSYRQQAQAISEGALGEIVGGAVYWCGGRLWYENRRPDESDADYLVRNWVSFLEMSGDHIVEQHMHNIDIANWFIGRHPVSAIGFGGRARRVTGNQFDFFSVDFDYGEGCHIHSMCRQINGCVNRVAEMFTATEGQVFGGKLVRRYDGQNVALAEFETHGGPYVQEHVDLLAGIVDGKPLNETNAVAESTLAAMMGRISAYTGEFVKWEDLTTNMTSKWYNLTVSPSAANFETGNVTVPEENTCPVPGV